MRSRAFLSLRKCACALYSTTWWKAAIMFFVRWEDVLCVLQSFELLFYITPPSKVCPQCQTIVHIRLKVCKSCQHVFRAKRKAEHNLSNKTMKRMRVGETNEQTVHRQLQNRKHMASMRASETNEQTVHRREKTETTKQAWEQLKKQAMCLYNKLLCHFILMLILSPSDV